MNKLFISLVIILTTAYIALVLVNNEIILVDTPVVDTPAEIGGRQETTARGLHEADNTETSAEDMSPVVESTPIADSSIADLIRKERGNPNQSSFYGAKGYPDKNNSVNVKYKNSINGMKVDVIWEPFDSYGGYIVGEATIRFEDIKTRTSFSIYHSNFGVDKDKAEILNLEWDDALGRFKFDKKTIHIDNKISDTNDWHKSDIFFYDLDFDGNKELITYLPGLGNRGLGKFNVYEIKDGNPIYKEEEPYSGLSARSTIDRENKTISLYESGGACNSLKKIYRFKPSHNIKKKGKYFLEKFYRYDMYMYECHLFLYDVDQDRNLTLVSKENLDKKTNSSAN